MKIWIGKAIIAISIIHIVFGLIGFRSTLATLFREGLFNTVNGQATREFAFWFLAFGVLAMIFGALIDWCEKRGDGLPKFLGWSLLAFTVVILVIMPVSGGWLLLAPAIGAIVRSR